MSRKKKQWINGEYARLTGLVKDSTLNGKQVKIIRFIPNKCRWKTKLSSPKQRYLSVKPQNVEPISASTTNKNDCNIFHNPNDTSISFQNISFYNHKCNQLSNDKSNQDLSKLTFAQLIQRAKTAEIDTTLCKQDLIINLLDIAPKTEQNIQFKRNILTTYKPTKEYICKLIINHCWKNKSNPQISVEFNHNYSAENLNDFDDKFILVCIPKHKGWNAKIVKDSSVIHCALNKVNMNAVCNGIVMAMSCVKFDRVVNLNLNPGSNVYDFVIESIFSTWNNTTALLSFFKYNTFEIKNVSSYKLLCDLIETNKILSIGVKFDMCQFDSNNNIFNVETKRFTMDLSLLTNALKATNSLKLLYVERECSRNKQIRDAIKDGLLENYSLTDLVSYCGDVCQDLYFTGARLYRQVQVYQCDYSVKSDESKDVCDLWLWSLWIGYSCTQFSFFALLLWWKLVGLC
eukprot:130542_1